MNEKLIALSASIILLTAILTLIPMQDAESLLAIPPQRAFSIIFGPSGLNITAPLSQANFSITGGDVTFFPNNYTINLGPNATALFEQLNSTVFSLNGSIPVLIAGDQIDLNTIGNLTEISLEDCLQDEFLLYDIGVWTCVDVGILNGTGGVNGEHIEQLDDVYFNAEEGTVDDLGGVDCVNDVTYAFFDNTDTNQYQRQVIEFCGSGDIDDNVTWMYVVPQQYNASDPTDFDYNLFWTDDAGGGGTFIQSAINDYEENVGSGVVTDTSSDLELHDTGGDDGYVGLRYTGITVPNSATIVSATLQFHVDEIGGGTLEVTWSGEDVDDSPVFTTANSDLSSRTKTSASVNWNVPTWGTIHDEGAAQLTPNLATIVQEIVDRPGWVSGNDMSFFIDSWIDNTGTRTAESQNGEGGNQPELSISFTTGASLPVCWEFSLITLSNSELMDGNFTAFQTICTPRSGVDQLTVTSFDVNATSHDFMMGDLVFFKINRPDDFTTGDFEGDVFVFGSELNWQN